MNNLKLIKVNFAGAKVLTREQVREVTGGGNLRQCGIYPLCLNGTTCFATSGPCEGQMGTCGTTSINQTCTCAVVC